MMPLFTDEEKQGFCLGLAVIGQKIHLTCVEKGFWPEDKLSRNLGEMLMLVNTEMSEWLEWVRKDQGSAPAMNLFNPTGKEASVKEKDQHYAIHYPDAITNEEEEAADTFIRLIDICEGRRLRLGEAIMAKMEYNASRPFKHGKKF